MTDAVEETHARVADAAPDNWVDRFAPRAWRPYLRLARADRPIGTWLLFWPGAWALLLAAGSEGRAFPEIHHLILFAIGALLMRGAGCAYNDIVDRDIDAKVARTALRPIPSGAVSVRAAWIFLVALSLTSFVILVQFNLYTIGLGVASLALVASYPFMKRITYWPQAWLGLTFNWGALMGWSAEMGGLAPAAFALYLGGIMWTLGYDTIYAHQDKEDDALIGVKSTALKLGARSRAWVAVFYTLAFANFVLAGALAGMPPPFYVAVGLAGWQLYRQVRRVDFDDPESCLKVFRSNRDFGWLLFFALYAGALFAHP